MLHTVSNMKEQDLFEAVRYSNIERVIEIVSSPFADRIFVNKPYNHCIEITALHVAATLQPDVSVDIAQVLIENGANVNCKDELGRTPLHISVRKNNYELSKFLIEHGANVNAKYQIRRKSHVDINFKSHSITTLIPLPTRMGRTPLHEAIKNNNRLITEMLINHGANANEPDDEKCTPILLAGAGVIKEQLPDYEYIVSLLLSKEADPNVTSKSIQSSPLHHAASLNSVQAAKMLLDRGAECNFGFDGQTPLHVAASKGYSDLVSLMLNYSVFNSIIDKPDKVGLTVLHKAAFAGSRNSILEIMRRQNGGDLSAQTSTGVTVLDLIFKHVPRPLHLLTDIMDSKITSNNKPFDDIDLKVTLDFEMFVPQEKQMSVLMAMLRACSNTQKLMLFQHPLIETYLRLKWIRLRIFFFILVFIQILFVLSLSFHIFLALYTFADKLLLIRTIVRFVLSATSLILFCHAVIQLMLLKDEFLTQYELGFKLISTISAFVLSLCIEENTNLKDQNQIYFHVSSVTVLIAWFEVMLLMGRYPKYGYYTLMFSTVLQNVLKCLFTFICPIIGFALSFAIQLHENPQFKDPWKSFARTIVMMMGEYDYNDAFREASNETSTEEPMATSKLEFTTRATMLAFIILSTLSLLNLLVGLAVSDTQTLQAQGHVQRLLKQTIFLFEVEQAWSNRLLKFDWFPIYKIYYLRRCNDKKLVIKPGQKNYSINDIRPLKIFNFVLIESIMKILDNNRSNADKQEDSNLNVAGKLQKLQEQINYIKELLEKNVIKEQPR